MKAPSEDFECKAFVRWLETQPKLLFSHLAQSTPTTPQAAARNKAMGVRRGVPDYIIAHKRTKRKLFLEMKRVRGTKPRPDQRRWLKALRGVVCYGAKEAIATTKERFDL